MTDATPSSNDCTLDTVDRVCRGVASIQEGKQVRSLIVKLLDERHACDPWLKDTETPAQRLESNHREGLALLGLLAKEKRKVEAYEELLGQRGDKLKECSHETTPSQFNVAPQTPQPDDPPATPTA